MASRIDKVIPQYNTTATVTVGGTDSAIVDLQDKTLAGIFVPSTFDGTTITIKASDTLAFTNSYNVQASAISSSNYTITTTASNYIPIDNMAITSGLRYIKLICGSTQTTTDTVFILALRNI